MPSASVSKKIIEVDFGVAALLPKVHVVRGAAQDKAVDDVLQKKKGHRESIRGRGLCR